MAAPEPRLTLREWSAEAAGTCVMVALGTGTVAAATLWGTPSAPWQIALLWAVAVFAGVSWAARGARAHLNPAVSVALAASRVGGMRWRLVPGYVAAQLVGAVAAGVLVLLAFGAEIERFEAREGLLRGEPGAERAAAMFGEAFPPPSAQPGAAVGVPAALLAEAGGTALLLLVVVGLARRRASALGRPLVARGLVALTVAVAILLVAPVTQCGINPARDLGPRLVAWAAGFGPAAFPGSQGGWWVYVVGPLVGGLVGAALGRALSPGDRARAPRGAA